MSYTQQVPVLDFQGFGSLSGADPDPLTVRYDITVFQDKIVTHDSKPPIDGLKRVRGIIVCENLHDLFNYVGTDDAILTLESGDQVRILVNNLEGQIHVNDDMSSVAP